jgi:ketosteroid isomerase-like protein
MNVAILYLCTTLSTLALTAGLQQADVPQPSVKLPPELARVLTDYEAAWRKRDAVALANLFAEDGFVLSNNRPPVRGRAAIQHAYKGAGGPLALRAIAFATEGSVGYIIGGFAREEGKPDIGKFTLTLRKGADGRWLIMSDMDNSNRQPPTNSGPPILSSISPEDWREDLRYFAIEIEKRHKNAFHHVSRGEFDRDVKALDAAIPSLHAGAIVVGLMKLTAKIGDGHTFVRLPATFTRYPLQLYWFGDELRVIGTPAEHQRALGTRVVRIGSASIQEVRERVRTIISQDENEWWIRSVGPHLLVYPAILHGLGLTEEAPGAPYEFEDDKGNRFRLEFRIPAQDTKTNWVSPSTVTPLYRQKPEEGFWFTYLADSKTVYVNFRSYDSLGRHVKELFELIDRCSPKRLVIDLRQNGGGDYTDGRYHFLRRLKAHPIFSKPGTVYVLIGRQTFSAAMVNAIDFQKANGFLVGEPIGEKPNSYQEGRSMTLPHSGLKVNYSVRYYKFLEKDQAAVFPDKTIETLWTDYRAGRDPVLEWVLSQ